MKQERRKQTGRQATFVSLALIASLEILGLVYGYKKSVETKQACAFAARFQTLNTVTSPQELVIAGSAGYHEALFAPYIGMPGVRMAFLTSKDHGSNDTLTIRKAEAGLTLTVFGGSSRNDLLDPYRSDPQSGRFIALYGQCKGNSDKNIKP